MKLVEQTVTLLQYDLYKNIESAGRICYQSNGGKVSTQEFINKLISRQHYSPLEHGTVYLKINAEDILSDEKLLINIDRVKKFKYTRVVTIDNIQYITTNYRVLVENNCLFLLCYAGLPTKHHCKRYSFEITTQLSTAREFNRHRVLSINEMSTRYCNFSKDKFGKEITICKPVYYDSLENSVKEDMCTAWSVAENIYISLCNNGVKSEIARGVLPLDLQTKVIYTAFEDDWYDLIEKRTADGVHPNAIYIANKIKELLNTVKYGLKD